MELKKEAIEQEIIMCQQLVDRYEGKLEKNRSELAAVDDRLAVLNALEEKLESKLKMLNSEDIRNLADKRLELSSEIRRYQGTVSNMQANIRALNELLAENF